MLSLLWNGSLLLTAFAAVAFCVHVLRAWRQLERLRDHPSPEPATWPRVSMIVPARDEAADVEGAVRSHLAQDYPALELITVDDRSTDGTGAILDRLAAEQPRLSVVHLTALPDGWLGKVHALQRGVERATGEWLLFTDADIHYTPDALRRVVAHCEARGLDFLTVVPDFTPSSFWSEVALGQFYRLIALKITPRLIADPRSKASMGAGLFNLVRRSALDRTPGLEWLKMEIADDATLGQMIKRSGARCGLAHAGGLVSLCYYPTFRDLVRGTEKGSFAFVRFGYLRPALMLLALLLLDALPFAGLLLPAEGWVRAVGAVGAVALVLGSLLVARWFGGRLPLRLLIPRALVPVSSLVMTALSLRSGYLLWRRGGVSWRDTLYPTEQLRQGARYQFP